MSVIWEEPSPRVRGRAQRQDWAAIAAELRGHPGEWAVIDTDAPYTEATNHKRGCNLAFLPVGDWEFTTRGVDKSTNRTAKVYGRYIGVAR